MSIDGRAADIAGAGVSLARAELDCWPGLGLGLGWLPPSIEQSLQAAIQATVAKVSTYHKQVLPFSDPDPHSTLSSRSV